MTKKRVYRGMQQYTRVSMNMALLSSSHPELPLLYKYAETVGPEMALTEYAARVCYNSVGKLGMAPTFVKKVLEHGHLSVAEHASFAMRISDKVEQARMFGINRFFTMHYGVAFANMRSWLEYLAETDYKNDMEVFLSIFPAAFGNDPLIAMDPAIIEVPTPVSVPVGDDVYLLAVNLGTVRERTTNYQPKNDLGRFTFLVERISRACSHQIARHRGASISEQSLRYVDASSVVGFTMPQHYTPEQLDVVKTHYAASLNAYEALRKSGMKKEDARFVLPLAMQTRMVISFNYDEFVHFIKVRTAPDAQWEVQRMARKMAQQAFLATGLKSIGEVVETWTESSGTN